MFDVRGDRNFHVVYVGGPANGFIEPGGNTMALLKDPDKDRVLGLKIRRMMPWYFFDHNRAPGLGLEESHRMLDLAGAQPWGDPVYVLEETTDPDVYRYRFIGEYDKQRDG